MPSNSPSLEKKGALYVVATPIGHLDDITLRALDTLRQADLIAAEDTRRTRRLLAHHNIKNKLISYHEHNEATRTPELVSQMQAGQRLVLVSDAGTPLVSDPGYALIQATIVAGVPVIPIPGPSAALAALSASGLPTDMFVFAGFLARKKGKRAATLEKLGRETGTLVFYESPQRILSLIREVASLMGDREAVLGREMTKLHEEFIRGRLSDIARVLTQREAVKGECTLLVKGADTAPPRSDVILTELRRRLQSPNANLSAIVKELAREFKIPKNELYQQALTVLDQED